ncbi:hypothetical protein CIB48_g9694 [Xylaria polymorpha]|nr:hypothetical protein CIB48_g9694 [Xylaria polymorpha]
MSSASRERRRILEMMRGYEVEEERRRQLTPAERLAEDRASHLRYFRHCDARCLFQPTPGRGAAARCSFPGCLHENTEGLHIRQDFRITTANTSPKTYYHVDYFEAMVDVQDLLARDKLVADNSPYNWNNRWPWQWGLMFRKWFEHKGCISLDRIAAYIDDYEAYKNDLGEFSAKYIDAQVKKEPGWEEMKGPRKPILEDYTTSEQDSCKLSAVMDHKDCDKMSGQFEITGLQFTGVVYPELE